MTESNFSVELQNWVKSILHSLESVTYVLNFGQPNISVKKRLNNKTSGALYMQGTNPTEPVPMLIY